MYDDDTNLYDETMEDLLSRAKNPAKDVLWVGSLDGEYAISWNEFAKLAKKVNYNSGYGSQEVASDLVVVGKDWWLSRHEYDGSESWDFNTLPVKKGATKKFEKMHGGMWNSLKKYNNPKGDE